MVQQYTAQEVLLSNTKNIRSMTVTSTQEKVTGNRGTVKFNGKTLVVVWDGNLGFWLQV